MILDQAAARPHGRSIPRPAPTAPVDEPGPNWGPHPEPERRPGFYHHLRDMVRAELSLAQHIDDEDANTPAPITPAEREQWELFFPGEILEYPIPGRMIAPVRRTVLGIRITGLRSARKLRI